MVPRLRRYYEMLRLPAFRPASLVALARQYHLCPKIRSPLRSGHDGEGPGAFCQGRLRRPLSRWRMRDLPGSWGVPMCTCPALRPRGAGVLSPGRARRCCLPLLRRRRPPNDSISWLYHTACTLAIYASQCRLPDAHARLASGRWLSVTGREFNPLDSDTRFQGGDLAILSSSSKLSWRNTAGSLRPGIPRP